MLEESLHGLFHFDTKSWRTLPLLVARPGILTKRYIDGQRVRYVSPMALFLFSVFLMFFAFSFVKDPVKDAEFGDAANRAEIRAELAADLAEANKKVAEQTAAQKSRGADVSPSDARIDQQVAEAALSAFDKAARAKGAENTRSSASNDVGGSPIAAAKIETGNKKLDETLRHGFRNPELLFYKLKNTAYKFSFMLIPITLPFLWLMFFWRKGVRVYDHAVFSLYSLAFMSLFFVAVVVIGFIPGASKLSSLVILLPPLHMFLQLRETYSLGIFSTLWRTVALVCIASTVLLLFMVMIAVLSMT
jgi:hypothetical protein